MGDLSIALPAGGRVSAIMLSARRRCFGLAAFTLLALPLAVGLVAPDHSVSALKKEGRLPAAAPGMPASAEDWLTLPTKLDIFLKDHFGLREAMIRLERNLTAPLAGSNSVLVGRDGRMFLLLQDTVKQSAGVVLRDERVGETANLLARIRDALALRGVRFLVASPPNASTIYQEDLPLWAQSDGRRTEYDLFLADLGGRGVKAVDLRPALIRLKTKAPAYFTHDTHWTARGGIAGFNAIVEAAGHPDWRIDDPATALGRPTTRRGGDLARLMGVADRVSEPEEPLALPAGNKEELALSPKDKKDPSAASFAAYVETSDRPGPTIMIIGDSFTQFYFAPMLMPHAAKVVWLYHDFCAFDWARIDEFRPDEVWWLPTERSLVCAPGARPAGFSG